MKNWLVALMFLVPAAIHLIPVVGVLGPSQLQSLYGLDFADPSLQVLMRHRAVLFGLVGTLLAVAAFRPALRSTALVAGFGSVVPFLALAHGVDGANAQVMRVAAADWVALGCLAAAAAMYRAHPEKDPR
jgi:hypothetical protein